MEIHTHILHGGLFRSLRQLRLSWVKLASEGRSGSAGIASVLPHTMKNFEMEFRDVGIRGEEQELPAKTRSQLELRRQPLTKMKKSRLETPLSWRYSHAPEALRTNGPARKQSDQKTHSTSGSKVIRKHTSPLGTMKRPASRRCTETPSHQPTKSVEEAARTERPRTDD